MDSGLDGAPDGALHAGAGEGDRLTPRGRCRVVAFDRCRVTVYGDCEITAYDDCEITILPEQPLE